MLIYLKDYDVVSGTVIDKMHGLLLGVVIIIANQRSMYYYSQLFETVCGVFQAVFIEHSATFETQNSHQCPT